MKYREQIVFPVELNFKVQIKFLILKLKATNISYPLDPYISYKNKICKEIHACFTIEKKLY